MGLQNQDFGFDFGTVRHFYLCNYKPKSQGLDNLSKSLLHFKNGSSMDVAAWTECALSELENIMFEKPCLILRALTSDEESVSPLSDKPLDILGRKLADKLNTRYKPNLLIKSRQTRKLKFLSALERENEMTDVYSISKPNFLKDFKSILILDDILTSGATLHSIARVIREVHHCTLYSFTLARTDRNSILNQKVHLSGYSYEWEDNTGWMVAEEDDNFMAQILELKNIIMTDSFYEI